MTKIKLFYQGTDEGFCRVDYCTYHDDPEMGIRTRFCLLNDGPDTLDFYLRTDWDEPVDTVDIKNEFIMELPRPHQI